MAKISLRSKSRLAKGLLLFSACIGIALAVCLALLFSDLRANRIEEDQRVYGVLQDNIVRFQRIITHAGGSRHSLEHEAFRTVPFFAQASYEQIAAQMIDTSRMTSPARGDVNPFDSNSTMYALLSHIRTLVQGNFDFDTLLLYAPASDLCVGAKEQGLSFMVCHGTNEICSALSLGEGEWQRLLSANSISFSTSNRVLNVQDKVIFSMKLKDGVVAIFGMMDDAMEVSLLNHNFGTLHLPSGIAIMHRDDNNGLYWLGSRNWYVTPSSFLNMGEMDWSAMPDIFAVERDGKRFTAMQTMMEPYGLRYIAVFEDNGNVLLNWERFQLFWLLSGVWLTVLLLCFLILFQEWYKPIRGIASQIPFENPSERCLDEYEAVSLHIQQMTGQMDDRNTLVSQQAHLLRKAFLWRLIISPVFYPAPEEIERYGLSSLLDRYAVAVFYPGNRSRWNAAGGNRQEPPYYDTAAALSAQDLLAESMAGYETVILMNGNQLIMLAASKTLQVTALHALLSDCAQRLSVALSASVCVHCSDSVSGAEKLHSAYRSALLSPAILHRQMPTDDSDALRKSSSDGRIRLNAELRLANLIYIGDYDNAALLFREIVESIYHAEYAAHIRNTLLHNLIGKTYCLLVESGEHNPRVLDNALMLAHSTDLNSQQDLLALWQSVFLFLRNTRKQSERHSPLFQEIDAYMRAHFRESGMSLATLADAFNVSSATISREFKKNTGTGFLECLHRLRIEAAKAEISATQTPIKDIALHVGYDNALTMTWAFKKYEGATPNTFRNLDGGR